jgi:hypothetical protein
LSPIAPAVRQTGKMRAPRISSAEADEALKDRRPRSQNSKRTAAFLR